MRSFKSQSGLTAISDIKYYINVTQCIMIQMNLLYLYRMSPHKFQRGIWRSSCPACQWNTIMLCMFVTAPQQLSFYFINLNVTILTRWWTQVHTETKEVEDKRILMYTMAKSRQNKGKRWPTKNYSLQRKMTYRLQHKIYINTTWIKTKLQNTVNI